MKVIAPLALTTAMLTSSTVPETDYTEWAAGTAYTVGQRCMRSSVHKCFEALTANTGKTPESSPTDWLDLGATNRWKMFDQKVGTRTQSTTSMTYVITPGQVVSGIALLELSASSVSVTISDDTDGVVYSQSANLSNSLMAADFWHYFFDPITRRTSVIFSGIPPYWGATVTITVSGGAGEMIECGVCVLGSLTEFAEAVRYGARVGIIDYSAKSTDAFGNVVVVQRAFSKRASWQFLLKNSDIDLYQSLLASLRATPAVYIGADQYDSMALYGFFKDFDTVISYPTVSECSIELEGLV